jgi:hypothetical protein
MTSLVCPPLVLTGFTRPTTTTTTTKKCESYCAMEFGLAGREREMKRTPV